MRTDEGEPRVRGCASDVWALEYNAFGVILILGRPTPTNHYPKISSRQREPCDTPHAYAIGSTAAPWNTGSRTAIGPSGLNVGGCGRFLGSPQILAKCQRFELSGGNRLRLADLLRRSNSR